MLWCSTCLLENADGSIGCSSCGIVIYSQRGPTTRILAYPARAFPPLGHDVHIGKLTENGVAFYIGESKEPLISEVTDRVILGRSSEQAQLGLLHLTSFEAYKSSISRNHA